MLNKVYILLILIVPFRLQAEVCTIGIKEKSLAPYRYHTTDQNSLAECQMEAVRWVSSQSGIKSKLKFGKVEIKITDEDIIRFITQHYSLTIENKSYTLKNCELKNYRNHLLSNDGTYLKEFCTPDTLYSWGTLQKANHFTKLLSETPQENDTAFSRILYTSRTPLSTHAYGDVLLRIKLKKGSKINIYSIAGQAMNNETMIKICKSNSIAAVYYTRDHLMPEPASMVDFIICNTKSIESISYGQENTVKELLLEYLWLNHHSASDYDLWFKAGSVDLLYPRAVVDGKYWNHDQLLKKIIVQYRLYLDSKSFFSQRRNDIISLESHFQTDHSNYFTLD